ncbi:hypothetical protein HOT94_gp057 [Gordonia phage Phistory]|uniref:Uncharacterized protein n=1 Tax=Gordonia phage Phistory TaxID=2301694 RepID=A0A385E1L5_9CAUD|nr:hypothetical protein HOT94_gp057 [Gordonia phage Phistory]AXQ64762.1 hypothetical protein SEA_PHISTORY_57 [Gordonia phage Phistory]
MTATRFSFYAEPAPVATRNDDCYVGVGECTDGAEAIAIVTPGDLHLSHEQARALVAELSSAITVLSEGAEA